MNALPVFVEVSVRRLLHGFLELVLLFWGRRSDRRVEQGLLRLSAALQARQHLATRFVVQGHGGPDLGQGPAFAQRFQAACPAVEGKGDQGMPAMDWL